MSSKYRLSRRRWGVHIPLLAAPLIAFVLGATPAQAQFGKDFRAAPVNQSGGQNAPAFPGNSAAWAGSCDLGAAPAPGSGPIPGGVGERPETMLDHNPDGLTSGYPQKSVPAPQTPPDCIEFGSPGRYPGVGNDAIWSDPPSWRLASETQAASHPDSSVSFWLRRVTQQAGGTHRVVDGHLDNAYAELPAGFAGDPRAVPQCTEEQLTVKPPKCPPASQVGVVHLITAGAIGVEYGAFADELTPLYNIEPRKGELAAFAFPYASNENALPVRISARVRSNGDFGITTFSAQAPTALQVISTAVTIWGVPWAPHNDLWRSAEGKGTGAADDIPLNGYPADKQIPYKPSWGPIKPFLTQETDCSTDSEIDLLIDNYEDAGGFINKNTVPPQGDPDPDDPNWKRHSTPQPELSGCEKVPFEPEIDVEPTSTRADSPTGLEIEMSVPQNNGLPFEPPAEGAGQSKIDDYVAEATEHWRSDEGLATAHLKDAVVTLPEGVSVNPSGANGQKACSPEQIGLTTPVGQAEEIRFNNRKPACPDASKIGTVAIETPVLAEEDWPEGTVYLASQNENPFGSLLSIYIAAESPERGLTIKLAGEVAPDEQSGQLVTRFRNNPELPFERFLLKFRSGPRAPLANPGNCGSHEVSASLASYSRPDNPVELTDSWTVDQAPDGGACPSSLEGRPFAPDLTAGLLSAQGGAQSPLVLQLIRPDGHQELATMSVATPEGITGMLKGIPRCANAAANSGTCPAASKIGSSIIGAGAGPSPFYIQPPDEGEVFLAGPYKGAPLSMAISVPAKAGPFDLGKVNVRAALHLDPRTAKITVKSDPIPRIVEGIPLRNRDLRVMLDRPGFTVAPTDCQARSIDVSVGGSHGAVANLREPFRISGCNNLGFTPKLDFKADNPDAVNISDHPAIESTLSFSHPAGAFDPNRTANRDVLPEANVSKAQITLPASMLLDQDALQTICTRAQFAASRCPANTKYGEATATSPLLDEPLAGDVYLLASDNMLPDLAADLNGIVEIDLIGRIDQTGGALSRLRTTFESVPDVAVDRFNLKLKGGPEGLVVNSQKICAKKSRRIVDVELSGQNGKSTAAASEIAVAQCAIQAKRWLKQAKKLKRKAKKLTKKSKKATKKAKKLRKQARKASGKKAKKLNKKSKRLTKKAKKLRKKAKQAKKKAKRLRRQAAGAR